MATDASCDNDNNNHHHHHHHQLLLCQSSASLRPRKHDKELPDETLI